MLDIAVIGIILLSVVIGLFRGFIKEIFGLCGICVSILLTMRYRSYFSGLYGQYVVSDIISEILSTITVFILITVAIIVVNGWIMHLLSSARCTVIDRFGGLLIGFIKGVVFSYFLFFIIETSCYALLPAAEKEDDEVLPTWFVNSYYYNIFYIFNTYVDEIMPESTHEKIQEVESAVQDILEKKYTASNVKKKNYKRVERDMTKKI
ncbi:colicin V production family protein [Ehrlichia chaffeensis str. Heartland]|uniref:CvpA family protein n=1 Tax=Ehrlichia chaffeensis (strain ATCC CRL-10679 / Arkansas) TaxID=205920 RepID=Q2GHF5_EHRCR|nr:CvpA family protein [Ehrlichia chaffeensis]ABD44842.1 CvpA family protein [Ehrlichia chaffeensis str. Arkansas]AHX03422.1 colicin V production family protein [Ehrlichia chaffeensis str. Heartland]AHX05857.1 colicin V production family protein [Ehrlichia chaffeensis str. Jax]AHX06848.1 colicin V production family protein [Ehrlichia chaffeensis str. Liberty]AHX07113.1 colicin V production family protein [Ehrlichia chaffeensis str. Osceola]